MYKTRNHCLKKTAVNKDMLQIKKCCNQRHVVKKTVNEKKNAVTPCCKQRHTVKRTCCKQRPHVTYILFKPRYIVNEKNMTKICKPKYL